MVPVSTAQMLAAERTVIATRFGGSAAAYHSALAAAHATVPVARQILADQLRRAKIEATLPKPSPSEAEIETFYLGYPDLLVRSVEACPAAPWLGGKTKGYALSELAPDALFGLRSDGRSTVRTLNGSFKVHALGDRGAARLASARPGPPGDPLGAAGVRPGLRRSRAGRPRGRRRCSTRPPASATTCRRPARSTSRCSCRSSGPTALGG